MLTGFGLFPITVMTADANICCSAAVSPWHTSSSLILSHPVVEVQETEPREVGGLLQGHTLSGRGRNRIQTLWLQSSLPLRTTI